MQQLRQLSAAAALVCALTFTTFAGDMNFPAAPQPTPVPVTSSAPPDGQEANVTAEDGAAGGEEAASETLFDVLLNVVYGLADLF